MYCNSLTSRCAVAACAFGTCFCVLHFHAASLGACSAKQTTPTPTTTTTHTLALQPAAHAQPRQSVPWRRHASTALGEFGPTQLGAYLILSFCIHAKEREGGGGREVGRGGLEWMSAWFKRRSCAPGVDALSQHLPPKQPWYQKKKKRKKTRARTKGVLIK